MEQLLPAHQVPINILAVIVLLAFLIEGMFALLFTFVHLYFRYFTDGLSKIEPWMYRTGRKLWPLKIFLDVVLAIMVYFAFFQSLEKMDRQVHFQDVELTNSAGYDATVKLNANANVYYQPRPAEKSL